MKCAQCGSENMVKIEDANIYDKNNSELDVFLCIDCVESAFGKTKPCDNEGYA